MNLEGSVRPHRRPGRTAKQERRRGAYERLSARIENFHPHLFPQTKPVSTLLKMQDELATLARHLGIS